MALEDLYSHMVGLAARELRNNCIMPRLINMDYAAELTAGGGTVDVPIAPDIATRAVVPGPVSPGAPRPTPKTIPITLDQWKEAPFSLTDRDLTGMENSNDYIPSQLRKAAIALANDVDGSILALGEQVYGFAGTSGITPFAISLIEAQDATRVLAQQKAPKGLRNIVLDPFAYANASGLESLQRVSSSGTDITLREGLIPRTIGFDWHEDQNVAIHTTTGAGGVTTGVVGAGTIPITGGTPPAVGDVFSIAGHSQTYVVLAYAAGVATISPALKVNVSPNSAITYRASHMMNLAFHTDFAAFASRPMKDLPFKGASEIFTFVDDVSGLVFRLEIRREHYQVGMYLSCMWGTRVVLSELACRIAG